MVHITAVQRRHFFFFVQIHISPFISWSKKNKKPPLVSLYHLEVSLTSRPKPNRLTAHWCLHYFNTGYRLGKGDTLSPAVNLWKRAFNNRAVQLLRRNYRRKICGRPQSQPRSALTVLSHEALTRPTTSDGKTVTCPVCGLATVFQQWQQTRVPLMRGSRCSKVWLLQFL